MNNILLIQTGASKRDKERQRQRQRQRETMLVLLLMASFAVTSYKAITVDVRNSAPHTMPKATAGLFEEVRTETLLALLLRMLQLPREGMLQEKRVFDAKFVGKLVQKIWTKSKKNAASSNFYVSPRLSSKTAL